MNEKPQLDDRRARMMIINQLQAFKEQGDAQDNSFFMIVDKAPIERVADINGRCAPLLKVLLTIKINITSTAKYIITSRAFEAISLIVIVFNSITLAIEDPTITNPPPY